MKLSTSTGDFGFYVDTLAKKVECFRDTKFRYINLELTSNVPELYSDVEDDYKKLADSCARAADYANVKYVVAHAPCLHFAIPSALVDRENEEYRANLRAIRRSVEVCHLLGIPRTVIHACVDPSFDKATFYRYNEMFYRDLLDLAEKHSIVIMTENWDNDPTHFSTGKDLRDFLDFMDHPLLAACWDTAHGNIAKNAREIGQYNNILALGDKLKGLHLSDNFGDRHHHSWPFAGIINFDEVMQGIIDVGYDGLFNFEASYTLHHSKTYNRKPFIYKGKEVNTLLDPGIALKEKAVDLLYDVGKHILDSYGLFEE